MATYRRPGVYLEESFLAGPNDVGSSTSVAMFIGAAQRGPAAPVRCDSWGDYVTAFGGFEAPTTAQIAYLPYAVYSFFNNGGRTCYVNRATASDGDLATADIPGKDGSNADAVAFTLTAKSDGVWGNKLRVDVAHNAVAGPSDPITYTVSIYLEDASGNLSILETFTNISVTGTVPGTRRVDLLINDPVYGSKYVTASGVDTSVKVSVTGPVPISLDDGTDGSLPSGSDLVSTAVTAVSLVDTSLILNITGHVLSNGTVVTKSISPTTLGDRSNVFVINDACTQRAAGQSSDDYATSIVGQELGSVAKGSSYSASYAPWIVVQNPAAIGGTITIPPGGAVAGVFARTDATLGVSSSPAGVNATIAGAIDVDARFATTKQGDLNAQGINVIRPVANSGITIMGGRTRKTYGVDRYISARRTLIYIKESLRDSTEYAVFENNSHRLWSRLRNTADGLLRPIWMAGGLRGSTADEAYFITCDESVNTPSVVASGEVRMEIGVALEYPAEFIVIRVSQFDGGQVAAEQI